MRVQIHRSAVCTVWSLKDCSRAPEHNSSMYTTSTTCKLVVHSVLVFVANLQLC